MTTFGGNTIPPLFGGGGGAPPFGGYIFGSVSPPVFGTILDQAPLIDRTAIAPGAGIGDILVAYVAVGPGVLGQGFITVRSAGTFAAWNAAGTSGTLNGRPSVAIFYRRATGDALDDCELSQVGGNVPYFIQVARFTGDVWTFNMSAIQSAATATPVINATGGMLRVVSQPGGVAISLRNFISAKQSAIAQQFVTPSNTDQGIIALGLQNCGVSVLGNGMIAACGYKFEELPIGVPQGEWPMSANYTDDEIALSSTARSGAS